MQNMKRTIRATLEGRDLAVAELSDGSSIIIGSADGCGLKIEHESISSRHSIIQLSNGKLTINDWHSENGTHVNGQPIDSDVELANDDSVQLGDVVIAHADPCPETVGHSETSESRSEILDTNNHTSLEGVVSEDEAPVNFVQQQLEKEVEQLSLENTQLREELENLLDFDSVPATNNDPMDESTSVSTLQDEIAQLQLELAERDQEILELAHANDSQDLPNNADVCDTEALVERLEQLLDELKSTDERVATLEDVLRASDEANEAEQEERRQIGVWLYEIESRISQRE